jgi:hydroxymethylbilane synthase
VGTGGSGEETLRLATRGSALALAQSRLVVEGLQAAWPELRVELVTVVTEGDRRRDVPAATLGGKGIFTAAVQQAVLDGRADLAVHSAKDLPAAQVPGLVLAAVPRRDDPRDVLVGRSGLAGLDDLGPGARVGTGSPRRVALLRWLRPDLELVPLRGNVDSRIRRLHGGELDAVVLAAAGLRRLGLAGEAAVPLDPEAFTPAPGQGTLAVEAREDDTRALGLLSALTHRPSRVALRAERSFLRRLGGSCTLPAGALAGGPAGGVGPERTGEPRGSAPVGSERSGEPRGGAPDGQGSAPGGFPGQSGPGRAPRWIGPPTDAGPLEIQGFLSALDGKGLVRERLRGPADDPEGLGRVLADRLLDACGPEVRALVEDSRR